jgi:hypothetical protein
VTFVTRGRLFGKSGRPISRRRKLSVGQLLSEISSANDDDTPPQSSLDDSIIAAIPVVDTSLLRAGERDYKLRHEIVTSRACLVLENELEENCGVADSSYPQNVERFRDLLTPIVGDGLRYYASC